MPLAPRNHHSRPSRGTGATWGGDGGFVDDGGDPWADVENIPHGGRGRSIHNNRSNNRSNSRDNSNCNNNGGRANNNTNNLNSSSNDNNNDAIGGGGSNINNYYSKKSSHSSSSKNNNLNGANNLQSRQQHHQNQQQQQQQSQPQDENFENNSSNNFQNQPNHNHSNNNTHNSNNNYNSNNNTFQKSEYLVLYTHQKTKKKKSWKDGRLVLTGTRASLYDACPLPGSSMSALDALDMTSCEATNLRNGNYASSSGSGGAEGELESEKYLIMVEGPWVFANNDNGGGGGSTLGGNGKNNNPLWNKQPQSKLLSSNQQQLQNNHPNHSSQHHSASMKKLLTSKFRVPNRIIPLHPDEKRKRAEQEGSYGGNTKRRARPLQPGELERRFYGGGSGGGQQQQEYGDGSNEDYNGYQEEYGGRGQGRRGGYDGRYENGGPRGNNHDDIRDGNDGRPNRGSNDGNGNFQGRDDRFIKDDNASIYNDGVGNGSQGYGNCRGNNNPPRNNSNEGDRGYDNHTNYQRENEQGLNAHGQFFSLNPNQRSNDASCTTRPSMNGQRENFDSGGNKRAQNHSNRSGDFGRDVNCVSDSSSRIRNNGLSRFVSDGFDPSGLYGEEDDDDNVGEDENNDNCSHGNAPNEDRNNYGNNGHVHQHNMNDRENSCRESYHGRNENKPEQDPHHHIVRFQDQQHQDASSKQSSSISTSCKDSSPLPADRVLENDYVQSRPHSASITSHEDARATEELLALFGANPPPEENSSSQQMDKHLADSGQMVIGTNIGNCNINHDEADNQKGNNNSQPETDSFLASIRQAEQQDNKASTGWGSNLTSFDGGFGWGDDEDDDECTIVDDEDHNGEICNKDDSGINDCKENMNETANISPQEENKSEQITGFVLPSAGESSSEEDDSNSD